MSKRSGSKVSYEDIANEAIRIINSDLKPELQKYTDISIEEVKVQTVYEGSIEIIYTVILSFLNLISGLKDLYDAVRLIKEISERHINKKLSDRFGRHFKVDTYVIVPEYKEHLRLEEKMMGAQGDSNVGKRDVFFYYLLVANIVLLIIISILVFGAVKAVYFRLRNIYIGGRIRCMIMTKNKIFIVKYVIDTIRELEDEKLYGYKLHI